MENQIITCVDCKNEFELTAGEQEFFASKNLTLPKRCKECRIKKKLQREAQNANASY